ncbi:hypothetical protein L1I30_04230 [Gillisia sp. M10.2A]|uniref:Uncharacterized protein n=1 Tax=Gillisia lutea TaxID=2909668 RepID=A0ABS9EDB1_9FLAO|nr:hypothetical protein [Gillisia lutea]MCF4100866.1 hypothetical protein [Gillisia lutea]
MIRKNILIGFIIGIIANMAGIFLYITLFSKIGLEASLKDAVANNYLGKIISLGAILNFLPFFIFLKKKQIYHARGVLLATVLTAVVVAVSQIL